MFLDLLTSLKRSWSVGFVALPCAIVNTVLICVLPDSIEAYAEFWRYLALDRWGGPETLFMINSGVLGWVSIVVLERKLGTVGMVVFLIALPWCLAAIAGGFALGVLFVEHVPGPIWDMVGYSVVSAVGASAVRTYFHDIV